MPNSLKKTSGFWAELNRDVSGDVEKALSSSPAKREALLSSLRRLEVMAREECDRRDTIQILMSGRRLLGDHSAVGITDGPFSHRME